jgi:transmembrane sensor
MNKSLKNIIRKIVSRDASANDLSVFDKLIHYQQSNIEAPTQEIGERIWASIEKEVQSKPLVGEKESTIKKIQPWQWAAAAIVVLGLTASLFLTFNRLSTTSIVYTEYYNPPASKVKTVTLVDGSNIHLNAGTRLKLPESFSETTREVFLEGEAFFDVFRDTRRPFTVKSSSLLVSVLGTSFNVDASQPSQIEVSVATGKVEVSSSNDAVILLPNQKALFNLKENKIVKSSSSANDWVWLSGKLIFDKTPFSEVIVMLEKIYEKPIQIDAKMMSCTVTGEFTVRETDLEKILEGLKFVLAFDYKENDGKIIISGKECKK